MQRLTIKQKDIIIKLRAKDNDWYVCETIKGKIVLIHRFDLSDILDGIKSCKDCGFSWCWRCLGGK